MSVVVLEGCGSRGIKGLPSLLEETTSMALIVIETEKRGAPVAQSVKCLTSTQVMIFQFRSLSPALGSVPTAQSLEPALDSVSPSLSAPAPLMLCLSLSQK